MTLEMQPEKMKEMETFDPSLAEEQPNTKPTSPSGSLSSYTTPERPKAEKSASSDDLEYLNDLETKIVTRKTNKKGSLRADKRLPRNWKSILQDQEKLQSRQIGNETSTKGRKSNGLK